MLHSEYLEEEAAKIAVAVMREYGDRFSEIIACCFSAGDKALYDRQLVVPYETAVSLGLGHRIAKR
ncbi:MAG: hypothetical protein HZA69_07270 [Gammaproteobacteria bacterium]|nr:hypothetical protein [Gammaproteobacteria bacterium]